MKNRPDSEPKTFVKVGDSLLPLSQTQVEFFKSRNCDLIPTFPNDLGQEEKLQNFDFFIKVARKTAEELCANAVALGIVRLSLARSFFHSIVRQYFERRVAATFIQKCVRGKAQRQIHSKKSRAAIILQSWARRNALMKHAELSRMEFLRFQSAQTIQKTIRCFLARTTYEEARLEINFDPRLHYLCERFLSRGKLHRFLAEVSRDYKAFQIQMNDVRQAEIEHARTFIEQVLEQRDARVLENWTQWEAQKAKMLSSMQNQLPALKRRKKRKRKVKSPPPQNKKNNSKRNEFSLKKLHKPIDSDFLIAKWNEIQTNEHRLKKLLSIRGEPDDVREIITKAILLEQIEENDGIPADELRMRYRKASLLAKEVAEQLLLSGFTTISSLQRCANLGELDAIPKEIAGRIHKIIGKTTLQEVSEQSRIHKHLQDRIQLKKRVLSSRVMVDSRKTFAEFEQELKLGRDVFVSESRTSA